MITPHTIKPLDVQDIEARLSEVREALSHDKNRFSREQLIVLYRYRRTLKAQKTIIKAQAGKT